MAIVKSLGIVTPSLIYIFGLAVIYSTVASLYGIQGENSKFNPGLPQISKVFLLEFFEKKVCGTFFL